MTCIKIRHIHNKWIIMLYYFHDIRWQCECVDVNRKRIKDGAYPNQITQNSTLEILVMIIIIIYNIGHVCECKYTRMYVLY